MTRRVRYLIDTPNATLGGDSYRPGRKGDMGAEAWVREEELDRLREAAAKLSQTMADMLTAGDVIRNISALGVDNLWGEVNATRAALAALPPPPGGDDEGDG